MRQWTLLKYVVNFLVNLEQLIEIICSRLQIIEWDNSNYLLIFLEIILALRNLQKFRNQLKFPIAPTPLPDQPLAWHSQKKFHQIFSCLLRKYLEEYFDILDIFNEPLDTAICARQPKRNEKHLRGVGCEMVKFDFSSKARKVQSAWKSRKISVISTKNFSIIWNYNKIIRFSGEGEMNNWREKQFRPINNSAEFPEKFCGVCFTIGRSTSNEINSSEMGASWMTIKLPDEAKK